MPIILSPLISPQELQARSAAAGAALLLCDCSFDLANPAAGARLYAAGHLPGAVYLDLERDLSAPKDGRNGRHPLPTREAFAARMAALGASDATTVIAYDNVDGRYAARLWWMLRWAGHADVAVLDGGVLAWEDAGGALVPGPAPARAPGRFTLRAPLTRQLDYAELRAALGRGPWQIVDARAADRFAGQNETLDPVAGHIPGALNRWFGANVTEDGRFKPAPQLRAEWDALRAGRAPGELVHQCGSGVTACHNLLALESIGCGGGLLYPGSWSEWCAQPDAPVALG